MMHNVLFVANGVGALASFSLLGVVAQNAHPSVALLLLAFACVFLANYVYLFHRRVVISASLVEDVRP